ncbi:MAG: endolytic transglycosylase MltG [Acutalibacteraceae bacterium]|nr:endolytic transglycosylase MltG [Acutalibacteraceae bacterium]
MDGNNFNENPRENSGSANSADDFVIGRGFEIDENNQSDKPLRRKSKHSGGHSIVKTLVWVLCIIIASVGLAFGVIYAGADYMGIGFGRGDEAVMEIKMGTPAAEIAEQLEESGAVKIPFLFRMYAKLKHYDSQFKYGVYIFNTEAGYEGLCEMLINDGAKAETVTVTIPEGTGINDFTKNVNGEKVTVPGIATLLEKAGVCSRSDFLDALDAAKRDSKLLQSADDVRTYYTLEGYLFPETYSFYSYDSEECAKLAVDKMLKESEKRITDSMFKRAEELGYSMNEILTMASIIQMESGIAVTTDEAKARLQDNMEGVASVFYNRLTSDETGGTLGSSPTLFYGDSFKQDDGRYNTQADNKFSAIKGLPPGPLCSPGIDAINAALYPKTSDYYYFVTDSSGNFYFHKTLAEQNATIAKLKQGQQWIYEYFN